jgi:hypothetical protein
VSSDRLEKHPKMGFSTAATRGALPSAAPGVAQSLHIHLYVMPSHWTIQLVPFQGGLCTGLLKNLHPKPQVPFPMTFDL